MNFTSNYPISESVTRSPFMDTDDVASNYPVINPNGILHDPVINPNGILHDLEYFKRSVTLTNDIFKRYIMEDIMRTNEMFYRIGLIPTKIIYNPPATIVLWADGTKTVVKCSMEDEYNEYYGFLCALGKKMFGTNSHLKKLIDEKAERHYPEDEFSNQIEQLAKSMNKIAKEFGFKTEE